MTGEKALPMEKLFVSELKLNISVTDGTAAYSLLYRGGTVSGVADDPVDFVSDMASCIECHDFNFGGCTVSIYAGPETVIPGRVAVIDPASPVCIFRMPYSSLASCIYDWPVRQHYVRYFGLYFNGLLYLRTLKPASSQ